MDNVQFERALHPEIKDSLALFPELHLPEQLDMARQFEWPAAEPNERVMIHEYEIQGGADQPLRVRVYMPAQQVETASSLPGILWTHGGGHVLGSPEGEDKLCMLIVETVGCVIVSPDYRLAPEHPYPADVEDAFAALCWMMSDACPFSVRADRLAVGGASAGGGLAAALALLARDRKGPPLCFQLLLYPMLDHRNDTPSSHEIHYPKVWNRESNLAAWRMYLGSKAADLYASPSLATDLTGLPPAYLCVGQLDPFRDETIAYAAKLAQAGIDAELHVQPGCYHGFENVAPEAAPSRRFRDAYVQALYRALNVSE
ncbi:alpha/beta hydrolase [Paenibacillus campi]|uniref:alpha/beta hydrolase n=1 Tax=Paenibacillus campi TaxID=3106031 RepID=UPI002AFED170|nr:alpha/beta hydrolase [Paenibacillus sp. SGZ-1014]